MPNNSNNNNENERRLLEEAKSIIRQAHKIEHISDDEVARSIRVVLELLRTIGLLDNIKNVPITDDSFLEARSFQLINGLAINHLLQIVEANEPYQYREETEH